MLCQENLLVVIDKYHFNEGRFLSPLHYLIPGFIHQPSLSVPVPLQSPAYTALTSNESGKTTQVLLHYTAPVIPWIRPGETRGVEHYNAELAQTSLDVVGGGGGGGCSLYCLRSLAGYWLSLLAASSN